jgi:hypothetical protein
LHTKVQVAAATTTAQNNNGGIEVNYL